MLARERHPVPKYVAQKDPLSAATDPYLTFAKGRKRPIAALHGCRSRPRAVVPERPLLDPEVLSRGLLKTNMLGRNLDHCR